MTWRCHKKQYWSLTVGCECTRSLKQRWSLLACLSQNHTGQSSWKDIELHQHLPLGKRQQRSLQISCCAKVLWPSFFLFLCCHRTPPQQSKEVKKKNGFWTVIAKGFWMTPSHSACCTSLSCKPKHFKKQINAVLGLKAKYCYLPLA